MKIAICLSGQPRNFEQGFELFNKSFFNHDVDYFMHHWFDEDDYKKKHYILSDGQKNRISWTPQQGDEKRIIDLFNPKSFLIEPQKKFDNNPIYENEHWRTPVSDTISMWYSRKKVGDIFENYCLTKAEEYDIVVWTRTDFALLSSIDGELKEINNLDKLYTAYVRGPEWNTTHLNTAFLLSNKKNIMRFLQLYDNFENLINSGSIFCDHRISFDHLKNFELEYQQILKPHYGAPSWAWIRNGRINNC